MTENFLLERASARNRLNRATEREITSHGLGKLVAKFSLRLAESNFNKMQELSAQIWPEGVPIPGTMIDPVVENGVFRFGLVVNDGTVQDFSVPDKPIFAPQPEA